jgi:TolB-like protein
MMEGDEVGTLAALKARRKGVLEPLVTKHQGRVFKVTGDGVLVEFASAVNAVQCAVDLQQDMAAANAGEPDDKHIVLRIGVNLGDVLVEGSDLYGDGVNIAARLEGIAKPGGVLVSGTAFDSVRNKIKAGFEDFGAQTLKNIAEPVRVYCVVNTPPVSATTLQAATDKPSIAVLPFTTMAQDPEQETFTDGLTEDLITDLSRSGAIFVIARNSCFAYKGKAIDVRRIAEELGVRYVLEGSARRASQRVRINVQLIDAVTGNHLWAERYDRNLDDVFSVQDEVTAKIVEALAGRLVQRRPRTRPKSMEAFTEGYFGNIRLGGLRVAEVYRWPGPVHEGHGTWWSIVDKKAAADRVDALLKIVGGKEQEPTTGFAIFASTIEHEADPVFADTEFEWDLKGRKGRFMVSNVLSAEIEPIRNPITGKPHFISIHPHEGFEYREAEMASATFWSKGQLDQNYSKKHAVLSYVTYGSLGIIPEESLPRRNAH